MIPTLPTDAVLSTEAGTRDRSPPPVSSIDSDQYAYDGAGNLIRAGLLGDGVSPLWEWVYDALGMQHRFYWHHETGNPDDYIYLYGPGNLRLLEFNGVTGVRNVTFRDLDGSVLREYDVLGFGLYQGGASEVWTHTKDFLQGPQGLIATRTHSGADRFFFADHLGTPRVLTDHFGQLKSRHDYYPYGAEVVPNPDDEPHYKLTGHSRDTHGLTDYMLGRTCAFPLMRFMSVDPGRDGWNMYAYVGGNPVNAVDPNGLVLQTTTAELETLQEIAGEAAARIAIVNGVLDASGLTSDDIANNEGAALLYGLASSEAIYSYRGGAVIETAAGTRELEKGQENLDVNPDWRRPNKTEKYLPPKGIDASIVVNPDYQMVDQATKSLPVSPAAISFHELAEAYGKIDRGMQYSRPGGGPGAHAYAAERERRLLQQRPGFTAFPGGGSLARRP